SPSSHAPDSLAFCASHMPLLLLHTPTVQSESNDVQSGAVPPPHTPAVQVVPEVQRSPSSQAPASLVFCASHMPLLLLQTPAVQSVSKAEQSGVVPPPHTPAVQVVPEVQRSPSLQVVPSFCMPQNSPMQTLHVVQGVVVHMPESRAKSTLLSSVSDESTSRPKLCPAPGADEAVIPV